MRDDDATIGGDRPRVPSAPPVLIPRSRFVGPSDDPERYELIGTGIAGGEGITWRARYRGALTGPIPLAVKMLRPPPGVTAWPTRADRRRWQDQIALLRHLQVPHVVRVHEMFAGAAPHDGEPGAVDSAYLVMEWVDGPTLETRVGGLEATAATLPERIAYLADVADGMAGLHSGSETSGNPALHRDIKPSNCIVHPERGVVLIDVTSLRTVADGLDPAGLHTPAYTAPEVRAAPHRPRILAGDVYSLGALAVFLLTGSTPPPVDGPRLRDVFARCGADAPEAAAAAVMTLLDEDPSQRTTDVVAWVSGLAAAARPAPPVVRRSRRWHVVRLVNSPTNGRTSATGSPSTTRVPTVTACTWTMTTSSAVGPPTSRPASPTR